MAQNGMNKAAVGEIAIPNPVAAQILSHLGEEQATLQAMLQAVRDVHQALTHLDDGALQTCLEAEARELSSSLAIQSRRLQLQDQLASVLRVRPADVTMNRLVMITSGSLQESIEQIWRSMIEMAAEVDRLNRQNAAIIGQSLAIVRGVVERLTGVSGVNESYNAVGSRAETHVGSILQWGA